jgi:hypothetical protein
VLNSTKDQGFCAVAINGSTWYVFYGGLSDGSQTYNTALGGYYKTSTDRGATWSAGDTAFFPADTLALITSLWCSPQFSTSPAVLVYSSSHILSAGHTGLTPASGSQRVYA